MAHASPKIPAQNGVTVQSALQCPSPPLLRVKGWLNEPGRYMNPCCTLCAPAGLDLTLAVMMFKEFHLLGRDERCFNCVRYPPW